MTQWPRLAVSPVLNACTSAIFAFRVLPLRVGNERASSLLLSHVALAQLPYLHTGSWAQNCLSHDLDSSRERIP
jgi:hypothetical protein